MPEAKTKQPTYRLFKVASELNIGKESIVELLRAKGYDISDKPTAALTQEMYDIVMGKFEKEHKLVEKQRKKLDAYHEKRTKTRSTREKDDTATGDAVKKKDSKQKSSDEEPEVSEPDEAVAEAPVESSPEPELPAEAPIAPEPEPTIPEPVAAPEIPAPVEEPTEQQPSEPEPTAAERAAMLEQAKLARTDELRRIAQQGRKKAKPEEEEPPPPPEPEPEEADEEPVADDSPSGYVSGPPKLQGLTVLGKVAIQSEREVSKDRKRKRKRIRENAKVDISAEAKKGGGIKTSTPKPAENKGDGQRKERENKEGKDFKSPPKAPGTGENKDRAAANKGGAKRKRGGRNTPHVDEREVSRAIRETFMSMDDTSGSVRQKRSRLKRDIREEREARRQEEIDAQSNVLHITEFATVAELANLMGVDVGEVIGKCIGLGLMVSINQRLDSETIQLVADEFGYTVEFQQEYAEDMLTDSEDAPETLQFRPPIVTIMGHVDHGKTSLLDYIRSANVVAGEAGGITQHIGAYSVQIDNGKRITFLDTPGHEAFTAMRARGAQVTDIVVLVVAADDSVMPQTIEAISHAQAANVPIIVAINKIDKVEANPDRIKQQLADRGVLVEGWGGKYQSVELSARQGTNVDKLLETILLEAELLDLKANPERNARGVIIESKVDKGKGTVASVLVQKGTLRVGDIFVAGIQSARVRALLDERGHRMEEAGPSTPAQVLGMSGAPTAGDELVVLDSEQDAREIATRRQQLRREQDFKQVRHITLDEISARIAKGGHQELPLIIKGDVDGSVEALSDSLLRLTTPEVQVTVVMKSVGEISESDVLLAAASNAIIIGFHVRPNLKARKLAESEGVDIRTYQIIYDAVNEIKLALEGMLLPEEKEVITATVEVRDIFKISRLGTIAGCYVQDGKITRNDKVRLLRDGLEVFTGGISSLRRLKDDVREVETGFECGIGLENMNDVKVGDIIEAYKIEQVKRKFEAAA